MTNDELQNLARTLEKTAAGLERHIATEAQKRASRLGVQYAKAADERICDIQAQLQRAQDLAAERLLQMEPLLCRSAAYLVLEKFLMDLAHKSDGHDVPIQTLTDALAAARAAGDAVYKRQQEKQAGA